MSNGLSHQCDIPEGILTITSNLLTIISDKIDSVMFSFYILPSPSKYWTQSWGQVKFYFLPDLNLEIGIAI